jgi:hypothetical protein
MTSIQLLVNQAEVVGEQPPSSGPSSRYQGQPCRIRLRDQQVV